MSPFQIEILLHYYARVGDYAGGLRNSPIYRETVEGFLADDLLRRNIEDDGPSYERTPRLVAYAEALCALPLPAQKWVMP